MCQVKEAFHRYPDYISEMEETTVRRDERGRLLPGSQLGHSKGQHYGGQLHAMRKAFLAVITPEEMEKVTKRHLQLIQDSNGKVAVAALELLYNRLWGKPQETIEVSSQVKPAFSPESYTDQELAALVAILDKDSYRHLDSDGTIHLPSDKQPCLKINGDMNP